jgi:hypothetical protein
MASHNMRRPGFKTSAMGSGSAEVLELVFDWDLPQFETAAMHTVFSPQRQISASLAETSCWAAHV